MKFKGEGNTIVWDPQRDRELCRFEKGALETNDPRICGILVDQGYAYEGAFPYVAPEGSESDDIPPTPPAVNPDLLALRAKGKELRIKGAAQMGMEKLTAAIAEAEKGAEV